jgi:hypothetical protein
MQKKSFIPIFSLISTIISYQTVKAVCPVCIVATGMGIGFSRKLGIDDTITGLWVGGLMASIIAWTTYFLSRHNIKFIGRKPLIAAAYLLLFLWPLYHFAYIGIPGNTFLGYDKLLLGIFIGIITFAAGASWYTHLKDHNKGHAYFPFQKVLMPVVFLIIMSMIFFCFTR